jgi:MFS-type transporter involved in bile tolerance (Atg22 family)
VRLIIAGCGVWWLAFSAITFTFLRYFFNLYIIICTIYYYLLIIEIREHKKQDEEHVSLLGEGKKRRNACIEGMRQLWASLHVIRRLPQTILFLVAAAFYNDGIQVYLFIYLFFCLLKKKKIWKAFYLAFFMISILQTCTNVRIVDCHVNDFRIWQRGARIIRNTTRDYNFDGSVCCLFWCAYVWVYRAKDR